MNFTILMVLLICLSFCILKTGTILVNFLHSQCGLVSDDIVVNEKQREILVLLSMRWCTVQELEHKLYGAGFHEQNFNDEILDLSMSNLVYVRLIKREPVECKLSPLGSRFVSEKLDRKE